MSSVTIGFWLWPIFWFNLDAATMAEYKFDQSVSVLCKIGVTQRALFVFSTEIVKL